jgi:hypothetical protein
MKMVKEDVSNTKQVPESNVTVLGLYVTPREAYEMWMADPDGVNILDVRSFEEYIFVGHAEMARNIPFGLSEVRSAGVLGGAQSRLCLQREERV